MGFFRAPHPLYLKLVSHTYPTILKLDTIIAYLKNIQKLQNCVAHPLISVDMGIVSTKISKSCLVVNTEKKFHFSTLFLILINTIAFLMVSAKLATVRLLKINVF